MSGADAGFLYMETPTVHMHTLKIGILEASEQLSFDTLVEGMLMRMRRLPPLRRRIVPVPLGLNHPITIVQRRLDPNRHFFRHTVGGDGTTRDLEELIGTIASKPLERDVPLWEVHVCEGLADGRIAVVAKIHHALADGAAANALLANVMDVASAELRPPLFTDPEESIDEPSAPQLVGAAIADATKQAILLPVLVKRTIVALFRVVQFRRSGAAATPVPIKDAPRVSFNGPLSARRSYATVSLRLDDCKQVRTARPEAAATLNDVVLAIASGALRHWLADRGERPRSSLTAGVPVGLDAPGGEPRLVGNNVSNMFTTLATDIGDPGQRLAVIARTSRSAKAVNARLGGSFADWAQFAQPALVAAFMRLYSRTRGARLHPAPFSVIVSNVPGPRERVKIGGALFSDLFSVGPLIEGVGLNITVWSYMDRMNFSLLACPDLLADVRGLADLFPASLDELLVAEAETGDTEEAGADTSESSSDQETA